jgi:S-adenosylmethionine decarboxylase
MALGTHLIVECYGCDIELLKSIPQLDELLTDAALSANATILNKYFHKFEKGEGITGFIALAESHLSVHTWPEHGYMAVDVFMCGDCDPQTSVTYISDRVQMSRIEIRRIMRGADFTSTYD